MHEPVSGNCRGESTAHGADYDPAETPRTKARLRPTASTVYFGDGLGWMRGWPATSVDLYRVGEKCGLRDLPMLINVRSGKSMERGCMN